MSPVDDAIPADGLPTPRRHWAMLAIALGITMAVLDGTIANVALPSIARALEATPADAVWIVNGFQLVIVVTLLPMAALGERLGYRQVFLVGLVCFVAGSLACALSRSLEALVAARAVQGLGAAGMMSVNGALVRYTWPQALLGRGVGLNALVVALAAALGPSIAAGILVLGAWPWLFAVNVPLGVLAWTVAVRFLPRSERSATPLDWPSAGLSVLAFGLLFIGVDAITRGQGGGQGSGPAGDPGAVAPSDVAGIVALAVALLAGVALLRRERGKEAPLIPVDLLAIRVFALSIVASVCAFAAYAITFLALPFHFVSVMHLDPVRVGLLMTPWPVALGLVAPLAGRLSDRVSAGALGGVGMLLLAGGLGALALLPPEASTFAIVWRMALCGAGFGLFQTPNNRTLLSAAPRTRAGAASGMLAMARLSGMTSGAAAAALAFHLAAGDAERVALSIGAALALCAAIASVARTARRRRAPAAHLDEERPL